MKSLKYVNSLEEKNLKNIKPCGLSLKNTRWLPGLILEPSPVTIREQMSKNRSCSLASVDVTSNHRKSREVLQISVITAFKCCRGACQWGGHSTSALPHQWALSTGRSRAWRALSSSSGATVPGLDCWHCIDLWMQCSELPGTSSEPASALLLYISQVPWNSPRRCVLRCISSSPKRICMQFIF